MFFGGSMALGIRHRLLISHMFAVVVLAGAFGAFVYWMAQDQLKLRVQAQLAGNAALIAGSLDSDRIAEAQYDSQVRRELAARLRTAVAQKAGVAHVAIVKHGAGGNELIVSSDAHGAKQVAKVEPAMVTARESVAGPRGYEVVAQMSAAAVGADLYILRLSAALAFLVCVLAALVLSRHLAGRILVRITDLAARCRALANGEPMPPWRPGPHDELEHLTGEFNAMAKRLRRAAGEREDALLALREANDTLESRVIERTTELEDANAKLKQEIEGRVHVEALLAEAALTDPLTGLLNRRAMLEMIGQAAAQLVPGQPGLGLIVADIDHFKRINDGYGHRAGDQVLVAVARRLLELAGEGNQRNVSRWGGEEFLVLLPDTRLAAACKRADAFRRSVASMPTGIPNVRISLSLGVVELNSGETLDDCLRRCDQALYRAKDAGRNAVVAAQGALFATMS